MTTTTTTTTTTTRFVIDSSRTRRPHRRASAATARRKSGRHGMFAKKRLTQPVPAIAEPERETATTEGEETKALKWYERGKWLPNVFKASTLEQMTAHLHAASNLRRRRDGGAAAVCVKYFRPECPGCRRLAPKFEKIAETEFPDVVFVKVNVAECSDDLMERLDVPALPYVQIFSGSRGLVAEFPASLNASNLAKLRTELNAWRNAKNESDGVAELVHAPGWPAFARFRGSAVFADVVRRMSRSSKSMDEDEAVTRA